MQPASQNQWGCAKSTEGRFHDFRRHLTRALGAKGSAGTRGGGQPLDLELTCLPPGATDWPYQAHPTQRELFVVLSGRGQIRTPQGDFDIGPDDYFIHPPGERHQIRNAGTEDLVFYVIADNLPDDIAGYLEFQKMAYQAVGQRRLAANNFRDPRE